VDLHRAMLAPKRSSAIGETDIDNGDSANGSEATQHLRSGSTRTVQGGLSW
jgi:hypothetical protein